MKKARAVPCLAMMAAGLLAGSAAAQDAPGRAMAGDGSVAFDRFGNRNFQLRSDIGDGVGYSKGYQTFGIFQPLMLEPDQSLFFVNPRGIVTYEGQFAGSVGGGFRWLNPENERIFGVGGWYDHDSTGDFDYDQWGISLESLGNIFDFRANAYIPFSSSSNILQQGLDGSVFFVGHNIGLGRQTVYQSPLGGGDFEVGGAMIPGFSDAGIRAYAGGYYLQGDDTIGAAYGVKARIEALITQDFQINVGWSNDTFFDTNLTAAVTWYLGTGEAPRWFQRMPQPTRLYQQMERNYRNMVLTHEVVDFVNALRAGGTGGSGGPVGTPIVVLHVDNTAAAGGDGSVEHPLNQLPSSTGANVDIILVEAGTGTTANMQGGIVLNDWQRLLGDGMRHTFTSTQGTFELPGYNPGPFPSITNLGGSAVTLANHNEVAGFNIPGAGDAGIFGNNVEDFNIHHVNITDSTNQGIVIANASGTGLINNVTVTDAGSHGIDIGSTGTSVLDMTLRNNLVTGSGGDGLRVSAADTAIVGVDSRFDEFSGNTGNGVRLNSLGGGTLDALLRNMTASTNDGSGVSILGTDNSVITTSILASEMSSNAENGVVMRLTGTATGDLSVRFSELQGNSIDGVRLDLEDNSLADLVVSNNTITGGSVGLTFFIDGNTFTQPFSITNGTAVGGPDLVAFSLNLAGTLVFDTAAGASVPFAPANGTEVTTGLLTVNGSTNPPGWVVPDNSQNLTMTFNSTSPTLSTFAPGETFQWDIDIDPSPGIDGAIFGDDLIGSTVSATYADGQILAGSLVAVVGNPDASTFVATSGLGGGTGVHVVGSGSAVLNSATISNNTISRSGLDGVSLDLSGNSSVGATGVTISNNTITDNGAAATANGINVSLIDSAEIAAGRLRINSNTISNNSGHGIGMHAEDAALLNAILRTNTISDNDGAGVSVTSSSAPTVNVSLLDANSITNNAQGGVLFDMVDTSTTAIIRDAIISSNGGFGIAATATGGTIDLTVGGPDAGDAVLIDNNIGAGIALTLLDTATGTTLIQGNEITNTTALAGSTVYTGQAIDIRLTDSGIPATATATLTGAQILDNNLGGTDAADGNAGAGLVVFADNNTTVDDFLVDNNLIGNNGAQGIQFDRRNTAVIDAVVISNNLITTNATNNVEINARNGNNDINDYTLTANQIVDAGAVGVLLNVEADAQLRVDMDGNDITGSTGDGIRLTESINAQTDTRFVTGTWVDNIISDNGADGISVNAAVSDLNIGTATIGNTIENNVGSGIEVNAPGTGSISDNLIRNNGGAGIDLNITSSAANLLNVWSINLNSIVANAGDGIEILNDQARFDPATPGLQVTVSQNTIRDNNGRGIDILNRMGGAGRSDLSISVANNVIAENNLEGVYLVNTASTTQDQTSPATAALAADGSIFTRPVTTFSFLDNTVTGNGTGSAFNSTGLVVRVGTSDGGYDFTNPGGFASSGRGGVTAEVTGNTFGGNFGNDIFYQSFVSTVAPGTTTGTWDNTTFTVDAGTYQGDPLARLDLTQNSNVFDSANVNNAGAFYNDADPVFKSRDVTQTDPGPFLDGARERNAQRLAFRGIGGDQEPPFTPGGTSDDFLYAGLGRSTFRVLGPFDAAAGFIFDNAIYNNATDANGVFSPSGAGFQIEAQPYGWTLEP